VLNQFDTELHGSEHERYHYYGSYEADEAPADEAGADSAQRAGGRGA
jgi:hypothetical protein